MHAFEPIKKRPEFIPCSKTHCEGPGGRAALHLFLHASFVTITRQHDVHARPDARAWTTAHGYLRPAMAVSAFLTKSAPIRLAHLS